MSHLFNRRRALFNRDVLIQAPPPMANSSVLSTVFQTSPDGWHHIVPTGEHRHPDSGLIQVLDAEAIDSLARRFAEDARQPNFAGLLVDFDHFSYAPTQSSQAAGWIVQVEPRADGLWARIRWTGLGEAAIANGSYRFISPVWLRTDTAALGPGRVRPLRLDSAGLTNNPNLKGMAPLSNRHGDARPLTPNLDEPMKLIATLVGLPADASEDAIRAEITALKNRAAAAEQSLQEASAAGAPLQHRLAELEDRVKTLTETVAEADLNQYSGCFKPEARDKWKAQLIANRASALELLESLPKPAPVLNATSGQPVLNRASGQTPPPAKDFPALVAARIVESQCSKAQAVDKVIETDQAAYQAWLASGGGIL